MIVEESGWFGCCIDGRGGAKLLAVRVKRRLHEQATLYQNIYFI